MRPWGGKSKAEGPTGGTGESLRGAGVARLAIGGRRATWLREARNRPRKRYGPIFSQPLSHIVTCALTSHLAGALGARAPASALAHCDGFMESRKENTGEA